jgi:N utilization substance protein A
MNIFKLSEIVNEIVEEKGINKEIILQTIIEEIIFIYKKKYPHLKLSIDFNKKEDKINIYNHKKVVLKTEDPETEIALKKAQNENSQIKVNDEVQVLFDGKLGRIEIVKIKQLINQKIKQIEADAIYKEFIDKKGTLVPCVINKYDFSGVVALVHDVPAFIPKSLMIPGEKLPIGTQIYAIIKDVCNTTKNNEKILLERNSVEFMQKLLELEIPEIFDGIVRIEKIVRIAGYKTKVLVSSRDTNVNPVGTCIGLGGIRIKPILKEIGTEKLDIIAFSNDKEILISKSLKPAEIISVQIKGETAYVKIAGDQRAAAVGKMGNNVSLASQLVGISIEITDESQKETKEEEKNNNQNENEKEDIL